VNNKSIKTTLFEFLQESNNIDNKKDIYQIGKNIEYDIDNVIGELPRQISDLLSFIKNNEADGDINMKFVEEVKDGRTPKFNINLPLKLKYKTLTGGADFIIKVNDINFIKQTDQPSDNSRYINYNYIMNITKV
jgi:hypothetical protein